MPAPIKNRKFNLPRSSIRPRPLTAMVCLGMCYGLFGWHCSAFNPFWQVGSWVIALSITYTMIWGWKAISRMILMGPKILVTIAVLSMTLTLAVSFSRLFILAIMVVASTLFARLELQLIGCNRFWTLTIISIISGGMIGLGWYFGQNFYPSSVYELTFFRLLTSWYRCVAGPKKYWTIENYSSSLWWIKKNDVQCTSR